MVTKVLAYLTCFFCLLGSSLAEEENDVVKVPLEWVAQPDVESGMIPMLPIGNNMFVYHQSMSDNKDEEEPGATDDPLFIQDIIAATGANQKDYDDGLGKAERKAPSIANWLKFLQNQATAKPDYAVIDTNQTVTARRIKYIDAIQSPSPSKKKGSRTPSSSSQMSSDPPSSPTSYQPPSPSNQASYHPPSPSNQASFQPPSPSNQASYHPPSPSNQASYHPPSSSSQTSFRPPSPPSHSSREIYINLSGK